MNRLSQPASEDEGRGEGRGGGADRGEGPAGRPPGSRIRSKPRLLPPLPVCRHRCRLHPAAPGARTVVKINHRWQRGQCTSGTRRRQWGSPAAIEKLLTAREAIWYKAAPSRTPHSPSLAQRAMTDDPLPPWFGEEPLSALLLVMVLHHCATGQPDQLDSHAIPANAEAMISLATEGYIDLTGEADGHLFAVLRPEGRALIERHRAEEAKGPPPHAWVARAIRDYVRDQGSQFGPEREA